MAKKAEPTVEIAPVEKAKRISSVGDLLLKSLEVFKNNWQNLVIVGLIILAGSVLTGVMQDGLDATLSSMSGAGSDLATMASPTVGFTPLSVAGTILAGIFSVVFGLTLAKMVFSAADGGTVSLGEAFRYAINNAWPYLLVSFVFGVALIAGLVLLLIPGLLVLVWYGLFEPIFVLEGRRWTDAFKRSHELTKDYFWPVLGRFVALGTIYLLANMALSFVPYALFFVGLISAPLMSGYVYYIYKDLVTIKS